MSTPDVLDDYVMPVELKSDAQLFADMTDEERAVWLDQISEDELKSLPYDWSFWGRPNQQEPEGDWRTWLILAGRGWGKTRTGAEWINQVVASNRYRRLHLVGATASDIRDIMVEGPSGVIECAPPWFRPVYRPTKRRVEWPNGAWALCFSADEPERLRGEQCEAAWADELASWRYSEAWRQLMLGLRLGSQPRVVVTTTPKPQKRIKDLLKRDSTYFTKGVTFENFDNLAAAFTEEIVTQYENSRFGRQELYAEILDDAPGALWDRDRLDELRVESKDEIPDLKRIVVAVDPAISFGEDSNETGIVVVGVSHDRVGYVLQDASGRMKPDQWAKRAIGLYHRFEADRIVAEKNQGGDMVEHTIMVYDDTVPVKLVRATKGKIKRAEPVSALYEQGRVHHVGFFEQLEEQMCTWEPETAIGDDSPDRMDALVWGLTELMVGNVVIATTMMSTDEDLQGDSYWRRF